MRAKAGLWLISLLFLSFSVSAEKSDDILNGSDMEKRLSEARVLLNNAEVDEAEAKAALEQIQVQRPIDAGNNLPAIGAQQEMYGLAEGARRQAVQDAEHNLEETRKLFKKTQAEYEKSHKKTESTD